jgi:hypothetical protein
MEMNEFGFLLRASRHREKEPHPFSFASGPIEDVDAEGKGITPTLDRLCKKGGCQARGWLVHQIARARDGFGHHGGELNGDPVRGGDVPSQEEDRLRDHGRRFIVGGLRDVPIEAVVCQEQSLCRRAKAPLVVRRDQGRNGPERDACALACERQPKSSARCDPYIGRGRFGARTHEHDTPHGELSQGGKDQALARLTAEALSCCEGAERAFPFLVEAQEGLLPRSFSGCARGLWDEDEQIVDGGKVGGVERSEAQVHCGFRILANGRDVDIFRVGR